MSSPIARPPDAPMAVVARLLGLSRTPSADVKRTPSPYESILLEILT